MTSQRGPIASLTRSLVASAGRHTREAYYEHERTAGELVSAITGRGRDALAPVEVEAERLRSRLEEGTASAEDLVVLHFGL